MKSTSLRFWVVSLATAASVCGALTVLGGLVAFPRVALAQEADAVAKVKDLNKKAVDAYENLELDEARKFLTQALDMCAAEGLNRHPVKATTHLNLGVVLVGGLKQRDNGVKQFRRALEVDPNVKVPKRLTNPEIQAAFEAATKEGGEGETKPGPVAAPTPPTQSPPANATLTVAHDPITEARPGEALTVRAKVEGSARFDKLVLAYRPESGTDFLAREMDKEGDAYVARIPDVVMRGSTIAYYIEARGRGGQSVARNGSPDAPHVVSLGADSAAPDPTSVSEEVPRSSGSEPSEGTKLWFSFGVGLGGGYAKGQPEVNPNYWDMRLDQKQKVEFANVAVAKLLHFNPEIGYFVSPRFMLALQARWQYLTGASEVHFASCRPNGVCQPSPGAFALLAKALYLLEAKGAFQPYVSLSAGGGELRYVVDISKYRLEGCGGKGADGSACFDTLVAGPVMLGPAIGAWWQLSGPLYLTGNVNALLALPKVAANLDFNLGLGYRM